MTKATSVGDLNELHTLITKSLTGRIQQDIEDNIPTDAATLGAAIKFLKDNNVTADPADADDLSDLREALKLQSASRRKRVGNVIDLASADLQERTG